MAVALLAAGLLMFLVRPAPAPGATAEATRPTAADPGRSK